MRRELESGHYNPLSGWHRLYFGTRLIDAQRYADNGYLVIASLYNPPSVTGHVAVVRPLPERYEYRRNDAPIHATAGTFNESYIFFNWLINRYERRYVNFYVYKGAN